MMDILKKNKKVTVGLVISVICVVLTAAIVLLTVNHNQKQFSNYSPITFDEFIDHKYKKAERSFNGSWYSEHEILWEDKSSGSLVLFDTVSQRPKVLVSKQELEAIHETAYFVSAFQDEYFLIGYERVGVYRHSSLAHYCIFDRSTKKHYKIHVDEGKKLQFATWLPEKSEIVFVYNNNIYIRKDPLVNTNTQITNDGQPGIIYNGIPDWVYEEEVLGMDNALYFSKNGNKIAFPCFDDRDVEQFYYSVYGPPSDPFHHQYPSNKMIKYPKAGTKNPKVKIRVWDSQKPNDPPMSVIPPPNVLKYRDYLFTAATWISDEELSIIWMNRVQDASVISECKLNGQEYKCDQIGEELKETRGWVDLFQPPLYNTNGTAFLQIRPYKANKDDLRFNHIFYSSNQRRKEKFLTSGNFAVVSILDWSDDDLIHFIGTRPNYPGMRHLYSVNLSGDVQCITCSSDCQYVSVSFGTKMYVQTCSSPIKPPVVTLQKIHNHEWVATIEDNSYLETLLVNKSLPKRWDLMEPIGEDKKFFAPVSLLLPIDFDKEKKYPTLVYVYGGPGSQEINYAWNSPAWPEYLVTYRNIIYMIIDGRGTGFQSVDYLFANYRSLGTLEIQDQIQITQSIQKKFSFIDRKRTGIWGWSYGGYVSLMTLIQDKKDVFSCGISVAPPTDWLFYDSVYTERYMGLPSDSDNKKGYERASVLGSVEALRNKTLFLNHGTADDNVHYQQSMMLIKEMELRNIDFQESTYPDENHGLRGVSRFLYHQMDKFLGKCFDYKV